MLCYRVPRRLSPEAAETGEEQVARLRSALFVDFDNILGGLLDLDRSAAIVLATEPLLFLQRLARWDWPQMPIETCSYSVPI